MGWPNATAPPCTLTFSWGIPNSFIAAIGTLPFIVAGVSVLAEAGGGLQWVLTGFISAIVGSMLNAWILLVEILR